MREVWIVGIVLAALASVSPVLGESARVKEHEYVGVKKCAMCHSDPRKGAQYQQWASTKHAMAWRVLGTERAVMKAAEVGEYRSPRSSNRCRPCNTTAYGVKKELLSDGVRLEDGIGCERCHGPGGDYEAMDVMTSREQSMANGMIIPGEKLCRQCHTSPKFDYKANIGAVNHPDPRRFNKPAR